ncbi:hypothetical protein MMC34_001120 [Xylographa carneopallida]|nr:hypothetical protein [Xylographa carneopallida]
MSTPQAPTQDLFEMQIRITHEIESINRALQVLLDKRQPRQVRSASDRRRLIHELRDARKAAVAIMDVLVLGTGLLVCRR